MNSLWGDVMGLLRFLVQLENTVVKAPLIKKEATYWVLCQSLP